MFLVDKALVNPCTLGPMGPSLGTLQEIYSYLISKSITITQPASQPASHLPPATQPPSHLAAKGGGSVSYGRKAVLRGGMSRISDHVFFAWFLPLFFAPAQRIVKIDIKSIFRGQNGIPLRSEGGERIRG